MAEQIPREQFSAWANIPARVLFDREISDRAKLLYVQQLRVRVCQKFDADAVLECGRKEPSADAQAAAGQRLHTN